MKSDLEVALGCTTLLCDYADLKKKKAEDNSQNRKWAGWTAQNSSYG